MYKNIKVEAEFKRQSGIYKIIINNSFYIGSACNLYQRLHQHKSNLINNKHHNKYLQNVFNKYKIVNFEIISICPKEYLLKMEQWFIDNLKPKYNIRKEVHSNYGLKMSNETKIKHSKRALKWHKDFGFTKETIEKMKKAAKGRKPSIKTVEAAIKANKNRIYTDEIKNKMRLSAIKNRKESLNYNFKGEKNSQSKLKDSQILEIRKKIKDGVKGSMLALEYNVSKYCISLIKNNKTYSHVS